MMRREHHRSERASSGRSQRALQLHSAMSPLQSEHSCSSLHEARPRNTSPSWLTGAASATSAYKHSHVKCTVLAHIATNPNTLTALKAADMHLSYSCKSCTNACSPMLHMGQLICRFTEQISKCNISIQCVDALTKTKARRTPRASRRQRKELRENTCASDLMATPRHQQSLA